MAGLVTYSTSRLAASSARGIQTQLRNPPLLIAATVSVHCKTTQYFAKINFKRNNYKKYKYQLT